VPVSGTYRVSVKLASNAGAFTANNGSLIYIYKNGVSNKVVAEWSAGSSATLGVYLSGSTTLTCNAGDTIKIYAVSATTVSLNGVTSRNHVSIERLSGPSAIAASETVAFGTLSQTPTGTISGAAFNNVIFGTKSFDTHGAYSTSTGTYTVPIGGKYRVSAVVEVSRTGGSFIVLNPFLNGVGTVTAGIIGSGAGIATISTVLNCLAGQTINLKIEADGTGQAYGSAYASSSISIERIGN
jgi:hypothetical protein